MEFSLDNQEKEKKTSNSEFDRFYLNEIPLKTCIIDKKGDIVFVNNEWEDFSKNQITDGFLKISKGQNFFKIFRKAGKKYKNILEGIQAVTNGALFKLAQEYPYKVSDEVHWFILQAVPLEDSLDHFIIFNIDITPQKQAGNITGILGQILDSSFNEIYVFDSKGSKLLQVSVGAQKNLGYDQTEIDQLIPLEIFSEFSLNSFKKKLKPLTEGIEESKVFETNFKRKDGTSYPVEVRLQLSKLTSPPVFIAIANDITEKKKSFEEIQTLRRRLEAENKFLKEEVRAFLSNDLVGESPEINKVKDQIDLVADTDAPVLIQGETGTGKELIARTIHENSRRKSKALVKVNCPAIPRELFESEFFGHIKGSFTGAVTDRIGRFQLAHNGTLFLDEITEIPLDLQSKLLRVLQEGQFERVGDSETRTVDVRVVAATNRDLKKEIKAGRFREDLYYRLNVFHIFAPPLRHRKDDIKPLVQYFIEKSCDKYRVPNIEPSQEDWVKLLDYPWPGNVREMQNMIERALILCRKSALNFSQVIDELLFFLDEEFPQIPEREKIPIAKEEDQKELSRGNILKALEATNWKISGPRGAAQMLGIKQSTLWHRVKKLGLEKPR